MNDAGLLLMRTHPLRPSGRLKSIYRIVAVTTIFFYYFRGEQGLVGAIDHLLFFFSIFILAVFYYYYRVTVRVKQQALNSALAYTSLVDKSYFVYLRSFASGGRTLIRNRFGDWTERSLVGKYWDIEHALTSALEEEGLLVAIGDKGHSVGAAKFLSSDEDWRKRFFELCSHAKGIFILPNDSSSLRWEIGQIVKTSELATKTFFLMPPRRYALWGNVLGFIFERRGAQWRKAQLSLSQNGIILPDYEWKGAIFQMNADGKPTNTYSFDLLRIETIARLFAQPPIKPEELVAIRKRWFEMWPITWTFLAPGSVVIGFWVLVFLSVTLFIRIFWWQPFNIPASSMVPTLLVGDYLLVSKNSYGYTHYSLPGSVPLFSGRILGTEPQRGDVIVFRLPSDDSVDYIRRLIGLPGDRIQMVQGQVVINGVPVKREQVQDYVGDNACSGAGSSRTGVRQFRESLPNGASYNTLYCFGDGTLNNIEEPFIVPPGHYFMLGDNRDNSLDSRVPSSMGGVGYVPADNLIGKAEVIYFSVRDGEEWQFWLWPWSLRTERLFSLIR